MKPLCHLHQVVAAFGDCNSGGKRAAVVVWLGGFHGGDETRVRRDGRRAAVVVLGPTSSRSGQVTGLGSVVVREIRSTPGDRNHRRRIRLRSRVGSSVTSVRFGLIILFVPWNFSIFTRALIQEILIRNQGL
uniref:Uncharacterized protein n=1 Tax=Helianthus annuus TaxID=4232 RepID=A0A251UCI6_HELAN